MRAHDLPAFPSSAEEVYNLLKTRLLMSPAEGGHNSVHHMIYDSHWQPQKHKEMEAKMLCRTLCVQALSKWRPSWTGSYLT